MVGLINKITQNIIDEKAWLEELRNSHIAQELATRQETLCKGIHAVNKEGNIDTILRVEEMLLQNDLDNFTNSPQMKGSLGEALKDLHITQRLVQTVRDPDAYKLVDEAHDRTKNKAGRLPRDEARQFFSSHSMRLLNSTKVRLSDTEKTIITQRRTNIRAAEKVYKTMQKQALGITNDKSQSRGPSMGL